MTDETWEQLQRLPNGTPVRVDHLASNGTVDIRVDEVVVSPDQYFEIQDRADLLDRPWQLWARPT
jgi:hypothetical protein